jgi:phosphoribosyl-AMP cyclohydrolase
MDLDFTKLSGLVAVVIQDDLSDRVLMVGFMNEQAFRQTADSGVVTFYSRSRDKLWIKGESSGHKLLVREIRTDCDQDAVLIRVEAVGPGVCHEGYESCFYRAWSKDGGWEVTDERAYDPKIVYGAQK